MFKSKITITKCLLFGFILDDCQVVRSSFSSSISLSSCYNTHHATTHSYKDIGRPLDHFQRSASEAQGLHKALHHRNKLLEFDQTRYLLVSERARWLCVLVCMYTVVAWQVFVVHVCGEDVTECLGIVGMDRSKLADYCSFAMSNDAY